MSFFKGIRGKAVVPDKKEKTVKKPLKSVKMTKVSSVTEDRDTHYDDEKKKGEVSYILFLTSNSPRIFNLFISY